MSCQYFCTAANRGRPTLTLNIMKNLNYIRIRNINSVFLSFSIHILYTKFPVSDGQTMNSRNCIVKHSIEEIFCQLLPTLVRTMFDANGRSVGGASDILLHWTLCASSTHTHISHVCMFSLITLPSGKCECIVPVASRMPSIMLLKKQREYRYFQ